MKLQDTHRRRLSLSQIALPDTTTHLTNRDVDDLATHRYNDSALPRLNNHLLVPHPCAWDGFVSHGAQSSPSSFTRCNRIEDG